MNTVKRPNGYYWIMFKDDITGVFTQPAKYINFTCPKGDDMSYWEFIGIDMYKESNILVLGPCICPYFG